MLHVRAPHVERSIDFRARAVVRRTLGAEVHERWTTMQPTVTRLTRPDHALASAALDLGTGTDSAETADAQPIDNSARLGGGRRVRR